MIIAALFMQETIIVYEVTGFSYRGCIFDGGENGGPCSVRFLCTLKKNKKKTQVSRFPELRTNAFLKIISLCLHVKHLQLLLGHALLQLKKKKYMT